MREEGRLGERPELLGISYKTAGPGHPSQAGRITDHVMTETLERHLLAGE